MRTYGISVASWLNETYNFQMKYSFSKYSSVLQKTHLSFFVT